MDCIKIGQLLLALRGKKTQREVAKAYGVSEVEGTVAIDNSLAGRGSRSDIFYGCLLRPDNLSKGGMMKVNIVSEITAFYRWIKSNHISTNAQILWFHLFCLWNEAGFPDWLQVDTLRMMGMVQMNSKNILIRTRDEMVNEYGNVLLSDEELLKLQIEYPEIWADWIKRLDVGKELSVC